MKNDSSYVMGQYAVTASLDVSQHRFNYLVYVELVDSFDSGETRLHLATVLFRLGRTGEAREELAAAMNSPRKANYGEELARLKAQIDP